MKSIIAKRPKWLTAMGAILLTLCVGSLTVGHASAGFTTCNTDPIVVLSNGTTVTLYADTAADPSQITSVTYDLHIPPGVSVIRVTYDAYGYLEHLKVTADAKHYWDTSVVTTTTASAVSVSLHMDLSGWKSQQVDGWSGSPITVYN